MAIIRVSFQHFSERIPLRTRYEEEGYGKLLEHTNVDGSGYFDFQLIVPCVIDNETMWADGIDSITISNLPNPSTVIFEDEEYEVTDGVFQFTLDLAGDYRIRCKADEHIDKVYFINAS